MKTYFLTPIQTPLDRALNLGTVLPNPSSPQDALNPRSVVPIPESEIMSSVKENWKYTTIRKPPSGIFARWLEILFSSDKEILEFNAEKLIRKSFHPTTEYIRQSMQSPVVSEYLHEAHFSQSLYMVTGVMIGYNTKVKSLGKDGRERSLSDLTLDLSSVGVALPVGASVSPSIAGVGVKYSFTQPEFVFAYQLRKILYRKLSSSFHVKEYTKGALFSTDADLWMNEDDGYEEAGNEIIDVLGVENRDLDADELGVQSTHAVDEDTGEEVESITPRGAVF